MKLVQFTSGERIALGDLIYATNNTPREAQADIAAGIVASSGSRIVSGFEASYVNSVATVAPGKAILAYRQGANIVQGLMVLESAGAQTFDCSALAAGVYGLYVTFNSLPTDVDNRSLYASADIGFESNQAVPTRLSASFTLKAASTSPGDQYLQVATLTLPGGTIADTRPLLFEGSAADNFAPTWGSDADRTSDRGSAPITDIETMFAALKVAIADVKGGPWYAPYTAAAQVAAPAHNPVSVGNGPPVDSSNVQPSDMYVRQDTLEIYFAN